MKCYRNLEKEYAETMVWGSPSQWKLCVSLEGGGQVGEGIPCHLERFIIHEVRLQIGLAEVRVSPARC